MGGRDVPSLTVLTCPVCAAPLRPEDPRCAYCGSVVVIRSDHPRIDPRLLNKAVVDEQIAKYRRAVRRDGNDETAHYGLGVAYFNLGLLDEAADELAQAARLMPENPHIQAQLGVVYSELASTGRDGAEALAWDRVNRALLLHPQLVEALMLKAELHRRAGAWALAEDALTAAAVEQPDVARPKLAELLVAKAEAHRRTAAWTAAVASWREAAQVIPDVVRQPIAEFLRTNANLLSNYRYRVTPLAAAGATAAATPNRAGDLGAVGPFRRYVVFGLLAFLGSCVVLLGAIAAANSVSSGSPWLTVVAVIVVGSFVAAIASLVMPPFVYLQRKRGRRQASMEVGSSRSGGSPWSPLKRTRAELAAGREALLAGGTRDIADLLQAAQHVASALERKR